MKWQYKIAKFAAKGFMGGKFDEGEIEKQINEIGRHNWELVSTFDTNMSQGQTRDIVFVFKKPY